MRFIIKTEIMILILLITTSTTFSQNVQRPSNSLPKKKPSGESSYFDMAPPSFGQDSDADQPAIDSISQFNPTHPRGIGGWYFGGHAGGTWLNGSQYFITDEIGGIDASGFIGGALVGYNIQSGNLVLGIEGDFSFEDMDISNVAIPNTGEIADLDIDLLSTIRGRIGHTFDRLMLFGTAGFAIAGLDAVNDVGVASLGNARHTGYVVGAGVEWAVSKNLSLRGEYLYSHLGPQTHEFDRFFSTPRRFLIDINDIHLLRGAVIWRFGRGRQGAGNDEYGFEPHKNLNLAMPRLTRQVRADAALGEDLVYDWSGFYAGFNTGIVFAHQWTSNYDNFDQSDPGATQLFDVNGFLYGGQVGYNWHLEEFVVGVELEGAITGVEGGYTGTDFLGPTQAATIDVETNYLASVRARAGIPLDRLLIYVTGGVAFHDTRYRFVDPLQTPPSFTKVFNDPGYVLGFGAECAIFDRMSIRGQYLFYGIGDKVNLFGELGRAGDIDPGDYAAFDNMATATLGFNFRF